MPQQLEFDGLDREFGNQLEHGLDRAHGVERFLVAMAVEHGPAGERRQRQGEPAGARLAGQEFLEQDGLAGDLRRARPSLTMAGISSRNENRQLGSRPTIGTPRAA